MHLQQVRKDKQLLLFSLLHFQLVAMVVSHRDGARMNESCYGHEIEHNMLGVPPSRKIACTLACMYNLTLHGEVSEALDVIDAHVSSLNCSSTYMCKFNCTFINNCLHDVCHEVKCHKIRGQHNC